MPGQDPTLAFYNQVSTMPPDSSGLRPRSAYRGNRAGMASAVAQAIDNTKLQAQDITELQPGVFVRKIVSTDFGDICEEYHPFIQTGKPRSKRNAAARLRSGSGPASAREPVRAKGQR